MTEVDTQGLYFGALDERSGTVYASGASSEFVISGDAVEEIERTRDYDMQWWAGISTAHRWSLFNVGTRDDTYVMGVTATDGEKVAEAEIEGDIVGSTICNDQMVVALGDWQRPRARTGTELLTLIADVDAGTVEQEPIEQLTLPAGSEVGSLACVDDQIVVLAVRPELHRLSGSRGR
ncbi:hypothetical protein FXB39_17255 [Nocardioides sp. BGMRC 2183]|nr:hypothetical protein FXB39_17255 [Nocardioides sp. BGMRC 2183]